MILDDSLTPTVVSAIVVLVGITFYYVSIPISVKRFHDTNRSGWNVLWGLIPIFGPLYIIIVLGCLKGTEGPNAYGPPPTMFPQTKKAIKFIGTIVLSVVAALIISSGLNDHDYDFSPTLNTIPIAFLIFCIIQHKLVWQFILNRVRELSRAIRDE